MSFDFFSVVTEVNINCKCKAVSGLKNVNILWQPLAQKDSSILTNYRVLYELSLMTGQFQFGCTLNTTQHSLKKELQCSIIAKSFFLCNFVSLWRYEIHLEFLLAAKSTAV
ncbi:hypothetical protein OS493_024013 [Desmophyllum pertusum]|uniref:Uncharacterized protein n=1 Tax=Desmophyllum pertusum TaxID=174260 RepID=A0A9X0A2W9_9CNID|nr:hypothetical protein OS493_024013 [Desmophyllum pertusum]